MSENDFANYSTALQQPAEVVYQGKHQLSYSMKRININIIIYIFLNLISLRRFSYNLFKVASSIILFMSSCCAGHHVMAAPAPHAGVALITALNILEGYNITNQVPRNSTYHWIAEVTSYIFTWILFVKKNVTLVAR